MEVIDWKMSKVHNYDILTLSYPSQVVNDLSGFKILYLILFP